MHVYQLHGNEYCMAELDSADNDEDLPAANHWKLPSADFKDLWENLVYDNDIKNNVRLVLIFPGTRNIRVPGRISVYSESHFF